MSKTYSIRYKNIKDVRLAIKKYAEFSNKAPENHFLSDGYVYFASPGPASFLLDGLDHITCTASKEEATNINRVIQKYLLKDWFKSVTMFEQSLWLGSILENLKGTLKEEVLAAMKKNRQYILLSCRLLLEMGYQLDQWYPKDEALSGFKKIYQLFQKERHSLIFLDVISTWTNPKNFIATLENNGISQGSFNKVYFQGFYYITPIQLRFMKAFLNAGFDFCFLYNYDEEVKDAYRVWDDNLFTTTITESYDLLSRSQTAPYFSSIYSTTKNKPEMDNNPEIIEFPDVFSFVKYVDHCGADELNVISSAKEMKDILDLYFPDRNTKKHILSYPIGQYLFNLYNIWDTLDKKVSLTDDNVRQCLATGWANKNKAYSQRLLEIYDKLSVYFSDCSSLEEWKARSQRLYHIHNEILPSFRNETPKKKKSKVKDTSQRSRWEDYRDNPLAFCGPFSLKLEDVKIIIEVIGDICDDATALFKDGNKVNLVDQFKKLEDIIKRKNNYDLMDDNAENTAYQDEKKIVTEIIARINDAKNSDTVANIKNCTMDDFAEAMQLFIDGEPETEDDGRTILKNDDLSKIEGHLQDSGDVMLGFCDDKHLPGKNKDYAWPLTKEVLQEISLANPSDLKDIYQVYEHSQESTCYQNRYLFFTALQIKNIKLAYIRKIADQEFSMSPYLKILNKDFNYQIPIEIYDGMKDYRPLNLLADAKIEACFLPEKYQVQDIGIQFTPGEITLNNRCCCWLNTYDFILAERPVFTSKFQLAFYTSLLIRFVNQMGEWDTTVKKAKEMVFYLLPFWNYAEKEERYSFSKGKKGLYNSYGTDLESDESPNHLLRYGFKYLNTSNVKKLLERKNDTKTFGHSDANCVYCPHGDKCFARYRDHIETDNKG